MKSIAAILALSTGASGFYSGWNLPSNNPDGSCKGSSDWAADFSVINGAFRAQYPAGTPAVKVFTSSDCDTAAQIIEPAVDAGLKILATVWASEAGGHFDREKQALDDIIKTRGCDWLAAVIVGSEDLYRRELDPNRLADQIYDVRGMVRQYPGSCQTVPITHADTRTAWTDPANKRVIEACDILLANMFAYWKGVDVSNAAVYVRAALELTRGVAQGKDIWVGETGWPTAGAKFAQSLPSVENLQTTWKLLKCGDGPLANTNSFWFGAFDQPSRAPGVEQHFGVATPDRNLKISLSCP
ncbi:protein of unknown function [Taphrina deformans PYCC 5710]|uniref:Probable glucan endo-1,3-beta-glucosidase eglC n=1 Tax=Taphrina deformans (strain PYCC 5710 / ATCC 11124 / CBS 356.35 / IMI 108563 / JCM 9778 / NBRC 8474) TaxID=1097556 RepID=R4XM90_TAPDE|nr:protein of unknown function [Taphrina deformans PYCC 5710]|eukprot:CCG84415.1 protein of unknown function [Taphrina deformans PYCC 5710]